MGDIKHLYNQEAIDKLREDIKDIDICMFCTSLTEAPFKTRPMSTQGVDEQGNIWFFSKKTSNKDQEIQQDENVQLLYADRNKSTYINLFGKADVCYDRQKIEEYWTPMVKAWFTEGKDDPDLEVIRVQPQEGYYWDTKHGGMVAFIKAMAGAVIGKTTDDSIEGEIKM